MEKIKKENINGDTPLSVIIEYLRQNIVDKYPRERLDDYEHGKSVGALGIFDLLVSLKGKEDVRD